MMFKVVALAVAALGSSVAFGSDLGRFMLPQPDALLVSVSDGSQQGPYSKAMSEANRNGELEKAVWGAIEAQNPGQKETIAAVRAALNGFCAGAKRVEFAASVKAAPDANGKPAASVSMAIAGLPEAGRMLARLAADYPQALSFDNGVLTAKGVSPSPFQAWIDAGVLRVADGRASRVAPGTVFEQGTAYGRMLARLDGRPFSGLCFADPVGLSCRFMKPEQREALKSDPNWLLAQKVKSVALFAQEGKDQPVFNLWLIVGLDSAESATAVVNALTGFKALADMWIAAQDQSATGVERAGVDEAKDLLSALQVEAKGSRVVVRFSQNVSKQLELLKTLAK